MASSVTLTALGLNYSPNLLSLPEGSLTVANDVVIRRDNVIESRRGIREYSEGLGLNTDITKQLIEYKNRILVHYSDKLAFDTNTLNSSDKAIFNDFNGSYMETQDGLRIKSIEANKNLYFTTSDGIKKIAAKTAADFTTAANFIVDAGAIKAIDLSAELSQYQGQIDGFLPNDSAVAYRVLFGYKDNNNNLILGSPSDRITVYNYLSDVIGMDINALTTMLDTLDQAGSLITDGDYASLFYSPVNTDAAVLASNVIEIAKKLDADIVLASGSGPLGTGTGCTINITSNICTITFPSGDPTQYISVGDIILLDMTANSSGVNDAPRTISAVTSTTISFPLTTANANHVNQTGNINSYNYRNITATGDEVYTQPLDTLLITSPATSEELRIVHNNMFRIIERLKSELTGVISNTLQVAYVTPFILTENANTALKITLPTTLPDYYFVQVYRTRIFTADGVQTLGGTGGIPVNPDDEMRLVFEQFPTPAEITAGELAFLDNYPEELVENNTNLYTNPVTGEGILQSNDLPPFAKDINRFKNVIFYANTRTRHRLTPFQLLGVANINSGDQITISNELLSDTYTFIDGIAEVTQVVCTMTGLAAGEYFSIYSATDDNKYYLWYEIDGVGTYAGPTDGTDIKIPILSAPTFTDTQLAERTRDVLNTLIYDFTATSLTDTITITNIQFGLTTGADAGTTPFTVTTTIDGDGEDAALKQVLLSTALSAAQAIDETARSLVRVINKQSTDLVNAYYISSETTPPGQINLEAKNLDDTPFYVLASNSATGASFNPDLGPINTNITSISIANPTVISATSHGLNNLDQIMIAGSDSTPSVNGIHTITYINANSFSIPVNVTVAGTTAVWSKLSDLVVSDNEVKPNRVYYSKANQPEAVPILNYFDVGPEDKEILRIFPLRDSLFVFKQDGLYRVSGESAPFVEGLFDSSTVLLAADSVSVTNNEIYCWSDAGISKVTETGVSEISRPIDTEILRLASSSFTNFSKLTWGIGYDSDNSYTIYTNSTTSDVVATIAFRYSNLTNTWTNVMRTQTCGIINDTDDKLYMGAGDKNLIEQERKDFTRKDFADRDFSVQLTDGNLFSDGRILKFTDVTDIAVGDVITQEQLVSIYDFNKLLTQLELDPTVGINTITSTSGVSTTITVTTATAHNLANLDYVYIQNSNSDPIIDDLYQVSNVTAFTFDITVETALTTHATLGNSKRAYLSMFEAVKGDLIRNNLELLAQKLDTDPGVVGTDYFDRIDTKSGTIASNSVSASTVITASGIHELIQGRVITISGTQTPTSIPTIVGTHTVSNTGTFGVATTYTIPVTVTSGGLTGLSYATAQNENGFEDIKACFNDVVIKLNNDSGATFNNYKIVSDETKLQESAVLSVNKTLKQVTMNLPLQWVVGPMTVYKSIPCELVYAPQIFGDPLMLKQIYEATIMFHSKAFTKFTASFSSDLKPSFTDIDFFGQGNGIFGHYSDPGFGYGFFGGASNAAPFRTIIPRDSQRCRFLNVKIKHAVARELFALYGITLTGNTQISTRGYR